MSRVSKTTKTIDNLEMLATQASLLVSGISDLKSLVVKPVTTKPEQEKKIEEVLKVEEPVVTKEEKVAKEKVSKDKSDPTYTCICGKNLSLSSRKRHESTAAHQAYVTATCKQLDMSIFD